MGGKTAYPWALYSKITVEDRCLHKFIFCVPVARLFKYSYQKILLHIIRRTLFKWQRQRKKEDC